MVYRVAKVIDNNDLDKEDKIKVRIYPEFIDIKDSELPWIYPYSNGKDGQKDVGKRQIPENDSYIRVAILDNFWQEIFYVEGQFLIDNKLYTLFDTSLKSKVSEIGNQTYPQPCSFESFKDGSCCFRNTNTGEYCLLHNSGSYFFIDTDGNFFINSNLKDIKFYNQTGTMTIDIAGKLKYEGTLIDLLGATESFVKGDTFNTWLISTLLVAFNTHTHSGVTSGPSSTGTPSTVLTSPINYLSTKIKGE